MPFNVMELVPMSQALRDVCVGIIELAHPDTKPLLREDYMKAFHSVGVQRNILSLGELQQQRDTWAYLFKVYSILKHEVDNSWNLLQFLAVFN